MTRHRPGPSWQDVYHDLLRLDVNEDPSMRPILLSNLRTTARRKWSLKPILEALEAGDPNALRQLHHRVNAGLDAEAMR